MPTGRLPSGRQSWNSWYNSKRWRSLRESQLAKHPYCQCPHHANQYIKAEVVDHIIPHKGDTRLFYDKDNLQSLTKSCHDKFKQSEERGGRGFNQGCDERGNPLNQLDHWK